MAVNQESPKGPQTSTFSKFGNAYSKYLPTDKESFGVRYSLISFVISMFSLQLFFFFIWFDDGIIFVHTFYVIIAAVHFGLYYALNEGKLRLLTPWLIWKIFEIIYTIVIIFRGTIWHHRYSTANIVLAFFLVAGNIIMMFFFYKNQVETSEVRNFQVDSDSKKTTPDV